MSHQTYNEEWQKAQNLLTETLQNEPTQADRREQRNLLASLYLKYIVIANKLSECVDQIVQPQKLILLNKLLEATLGRILEIKHDLVEADLNEWTHCGDIMDKLHLIPNQVELKVPTCYKNERQDELDDRNKTIENILEKLGYVDKGKIKLPMTEQQAILIIQTHERARQGRLRAQYIKEIRTTKEKIKPPTITDEESEDSKKQLGLSAVLRIQKIWRGYVARKITRRKKLQEMMLIGMIPGPKADQKLFEKDLEIKEARRKLQKQRMKEFYKETKKCRENLEKKHKDIVLEQLSDQVRGWIQDYRSQTGKIPEFTGSERSTSRLILSRQGTESELSKSTQISSKDSKSKKDKSLKSRESKSASGDDEEEEISTKAIVSSFLTELNARKEEYDEIWRNKVEIDNLEQHPYKEIIEHEQMTQMENELRKLVDEMMRNELQLLQDAMDRDRGYKTKKKSSKKARRGGKKSKKKKEKDLTPDRSTESLFEELVANGIIKKYPKVCLDDFKGERSFNNTVSHNRGEDPSIGLGDLRQIIIEYCIIPLLTPQLHLNTPHIKSVLLAGAKGSGKHMLIHAICNEVGAVLFDLTPSNIVGKYPGKTGLIMLIHLVVKVSRLLQPSIIYMNNAERPFVKKIPKNDKSDPKRLKKDLPKIVKNFSPEDRVMLIGVTNCPWESDQKLLQQVYQKFIMIPTPNYSSRFCVWTHLLHQYDAISWKFDTNVMSKISDSYTIGSIVETINEVMTVKRMLQLRIHSLNPLELVNSLCKRTPIYKEEEEAFKNWWNKTPMYRRRVRAIEMRLEEEAEIQAKQANKKKQ